MRKRSCVLIAGLAAALLAGGCGQSQGTAEETAVQAETEAGLYREAAELLTEKKTTQYFTDDPVTQEDMEKILAAGVNAPSGMNQQPWHFTAVTDKEILQQIAEDMSSEAQGVQVPQADTGKGTPGQGGRPGETGNSSRNGNGGQEGRDGSRAGVGEEESQGRMPGGAAGGQTGAGGQPEYGMPGKQAGSGSQDRGRAENSLQSQDGAQSQAGAENGLQNQDRAENGLRNSASQDRQDETAEAAGEADGAAQESGEESQAEGASTAKALSSGRLVQDENSHRGGFEIRNVTMKGQLASEIQPSEGKLSGGQAFGVQPSEGQAFGAQASEAQPSGVQPSGAQPSGAQPSEMQPSETQMSGTQSSEQAEESEGTRAKAGIADAPLAIIISCQEGSEFDAGLACQNMAAEAQLLGYGTKIIASPVTALNGEKREEYRQLLKIPDGQSAAAILLVGVEDDSADESTDGITGPSLRNDYEQMVSVIGEKAE